jgi:KUP system potassium uptake protein
MEQQRASLLNVDPEAHVPAGMGAVIGAVGIVFGDIATSPLYALQECLHGKHGVSPTHDNVLGCLSLIIWSLILVVTVKYLAVLMRADNRGEGGIMALLALVPQGLREKGPGRLGLVTFLVIIGAALLFGDGVITPAISVLSAVEGLKVVTPGLERFIVPLTIGILLGLFAVQRRGSSKLGRIFGPITIVWLGTNLVLGVIHIAARPEILWAFSPHHAVRFFASEGFHGYRVLGGVVLAVTGGEALYADMGHFGRRPIRIAWMSMVLPALVASYLGQGALLLERPEVAAQPFYAMVPQGAWSIPFVLLATAATVIASQALITGVFSLVQQSMVLGYFPRLLVRHTTREVMGQIFVPVMNVFLGVSCILLVLVFRESSKLAAAYGLAVSGTMTVTSLAFFTVSRIHFGWSKWHALAVSGGFLCIDLAFLGANSLKILDGGYVPLLIGALFVVIMAVWARGRGLVTSYARSLSVPVPEFLETAEHGVTNRIPGVGVIMTASTESIPPVLTRMVERFHNVHETVLLTSVVTAEVPYVAPFIPPGRAEITKVGPGIFRVILRFGFMEMPEVHASLSLVLPRVAPRAMPTDLVYVLGHERYLAGPGGRMGSAEERVFAFLSRNAHEPTDYYGLPPAQVVEVGARVDL